MNQAIIDYYRCPDDMVDFRLAGDVSKDPGYFRFGPETVCYGKSSSGARSRRVNGALYDAATDVRIADGAVHLPLDPDEIIDNLRSERYYGTGGRPAVLNLYYRLRPFLSPPVRRHLQRAHLSGWKDIRFPRWPVDRTVDCLLEQLLVLAMKARGVHRVPFVWFWPHGATSCVVMTHDVEGVVGRDFCSRLMDMDDAVGLKASFQIVPEDRYAVPDAFLDDIRARGFEINVHDLNHDGRLFADREGFLRRAERINTYARQYRALGFRAGSLYRNQAWYEALEFSYDMSVPNVAHLDPQRGGCCTVMPYFIGRTLELPVTMIQDYTLFHILNDYSIDVWKQQLEATSDRHGLATFIVHPDYLIAKRARAAYQALLEHLARLREQRRTWIPLPRDVARWWQERSRLRVVSHGGRWRIEGEGKERARLAFAVLAGDRLDFTIEDQVAAEAPTFPSPGPTLAQLNRA